MGSVSRRAVANAIAARLAGVSNATGYYAQIGRPLTPQATVPADPPTKTRDDLRVRPYFVFHPGAGVDGPDPSVADCGGDASMPYRVTAVAGDVEDLLALVDRIHAALDRWAPTVPGHVVGRLRAPLGAGLAPVLTDDTVTPPRLFTPLEFTTTATAT